MKNKKRKNTVSYPLSLDQRLALWVSADLLQYLSVDTTPKFSSQVIESVCASFEPVDGDERIYEFDFTAAHHRVCSYALKYALLYLNGDFRYFDSPISDRIDSELHQLAPVIRQLADLFQVS